MKPNPSSSEAIRDPLGRDSYLWDQEEEEPDLNGKLEAARADWRGDASLNSLFGVGGAFKLEDTVGKQGKNRPGDVFKVQSLLHREGLLDAGKTDGPTGFLGLYDHEAIEAFQKENGLKVDGWLGPGGESIKAFEKIYAPAKGQQQPQQQPTGQLPWKDYSGNLLDNDAWDALLSRLPAWYRPEPRQDAGQAETLSGGSGTDDAAPMQLAQQEEDTPQQPQDRGSQTPGPSNVEPEPREEAAPDIAKQSAEEIAGALGLDTKKIDFTKPDIQAALVGTHIYNQLGKQDQEKILGQIERVKSIDPQLHGKLRNAIADSRANPIWEPVLLTDEQLEKHLDETKRSREWLERLKTVSDTGKLAGNIPGVQLPAPLAFGNSGFSLLLEVADKGFERALEKLQKERQRRQKP